MDDDGQRWLNLLSEVEVELGGQGRRDGVRVRQALFLSQYVKSFNVGQSAAKAGVGRQLISRWRNEDPTFHRAWQEANESVRDAVLGEVFERATRGVEIAIRDRSGRVVATERRASDRLLIAMAKALDDRFRESPPANAVREDAGAWRRPLLQLLGDPEKRRRLEQLADEISAP
jgi:hypothetical protein